MRHEQAVLDISDKRELCLRCDGYMIVINDDGDEVDGYPNGKAWHRFRE